VSQQQPTGPHRPAPPDEPTAIQPAPAPSIATPAVEAAEVEAALATLAQASQRPDYDAQADHADQAAYYQNLPVDLLPAARYQALSELVQATHTSAR
jgi:hypothetical protein